MSCYEGLINTYELELLLTLLRIVLLSFVFTHFRPT